MTYHVSAQDKAPAPVGRIEPDPSLPRACVIGAGPSGIAAAKQLYMAGVPFDWFEAGPVIGGNWVLDNPNGTSACYDTLEINTSCPRMAFSDFPMPSDYPAYARHDQVRAYFEAYVDHFGFRHTLTPNTTVLDVSPVSPVQAGDDDAAARQYAAQAWDVTIAPTCAPAGTGGQRETADSSPAGRAHSSAATETRRYAAVVVANGHHWKPSLPDPAYPGRFEGEQFHAHQYRDSSQLEGKRVLVVGMGNSAMDIAVAASKHAECAHLSTRRGQWIIPKHLAGQATDLISLPGWVPWGLSKLRFAVGTRLVRQAHDYGFPRPDHQPGESHPVQSDRFVPAAASGAIQARPGIERLDGSDVVFTDGTRGTYDLIVWCTGYSVSFPFISPEVLTVEGNRLPLYKRALHPTLPGLFFVGLLQPVGAVMPLAEAQGELIARLLSGSYAPPSVSEMERVMLSEDEENRSRFYSSKRHTMEVDFDQFLFDIRREMRAGARRRSAGARPYRLTSPTGETAAQPGVVGSRDSAPTAVVTGAGQGLGRLIALKLAEAGYRVHVTDVNASNARSVAEECGRGAWSSHLDVTDPEACRSAVRDTVSRTGALDVWINNAGVLFTGPVWEMTDAQRRLTMEVNAMGPIHGTIAALEVMSPLDHGHIVNTASLASLAPVPGEAVYAASKHATLGFALSTLSDLRVAGVRNVQISTVCPDGMWTPMLYDRLDDPEAALSFSGVLLKPEEVAEAVLRVLKSPRAVTAIPSWRGAQARAFSAVPGLAMKLAPAVTRLAEKQQARLARKISGETTRSPQAQSKRRP